MKSTFIVLALVFLLSFGACSFENEKVTAESGDKLEKNIIKNTKDKPTVLVELFTSEGCSSCPPADRLLETFETEQPFKDVEVITLSLHVDYWDNLGWKDPFGSALFSRRQDIYGQVFRSSSVYTPQMVIDGRSEFVGSDAAKAAKAIAENAKNEKAEIELVVEKDKLIIKLSAIPKHENATVYLAYAEDNLSSDVGNGENSGRNLRHTSVVRELKTIGMLTNVQNEFNFEQVVQVQPGWKKENLKLVVFVQENISRKVLGVGKVKQL